MQAAARRYITETLEHFNTLVASAKLAYDKKPYLHRSYREFNHLFRDYHHKVASFWDNLNENALFFNNINSLVSKFDNLRNELEPMVHRMVEIGNIVVSWEVPVFGEMFHNLIIFLLFKYSKGFSKPMAFFLIRNLYTLLTLRLST